MKSIDNHIHAEWKPFFRSLRVHSWFNGLLTEISIRRKKSRVFPPERWVFRAFHNLSPSQVKVVILGQDPYHGEGQAHGLAFSVPVGQKIPPTLRNIFRELEADLGIPVPEHGCLESWEREGVLLLNTLLTVEEGKPSSHAGLGWEQFTGEVIHYLCSIGQPMVFLLWGNHARKWASFIPAHDDILVLQAPHPSPFSAHTGFMGCRHFSQTNHFLQSRGVGAVNWSLINNF
ncbi:MAG: uracil-DNA glycosylase [Bacteroidales bacterium]